MGGVSGQTMIDASRTNRAGQDETNGEPDYEVDQFSAALDTNWIPARINGDRFRAGLLLSPRLVRTSVFKRFFHGFFNANSVSKIENFPRVSRETRYLILKLIVKRRRVGGTLSWKGRLRGRERQRDWISCVSHSRGNSSKFIFPARRNLVVKGGRKTLSTGDKWGAEMDVNYIRRTYFRVCLLISMFPTGIETRNIYFPSWKGAGMSNNDSLCSY